MYKILHFVKICLKDIKRLLAPVRLFLCPYATLFCWSWVCSVFQKPIQIYRGFELCFHSSNEFIMNAFGSRSTSVGHLRKYASRAKLFVCHLDLLILYVLCTLMRLQIIEIAVENQCKKKAHVW